MTEKQKGILYIIISSLGFSIMAIFIKLAGHGLPAYQKTIFRNAVALVLAFLIAKNKGVPLFGKSKNRKVLLLRASLGTVGIILFYYSIDNLITSDAVMLNKTSIFFFIIFSYIFLKEKFSKVQGLALITAFIGVLFIIKPTFDINIAYVTSILGAICAGGAYTTVRHLSKTEDAATIIFFFSFFSVMILLPFVALNFHPMSSRELLYLSLAGVAAMVGQVGLTTAYKHAPSSEVGIFNYFNVIFSGILAFFIFSEKPDMLSIIGYIIIFTTSYFMFFYDRK